MSQPRQPDPADAGAPLVGLSVVHPAGVLPAHVHHDHAQLMYAAHGILNVTTALGRWILPPGRALWIAAGTEHGLEVRRPVTLNVLFLRTSMERLPDWSGCLVVNVTPLLRELITASVGFAWDYPSDSAAARLSRVLIDQLSVMSQAPVDLPEPKDPRAVRVAQLVREEVADRRPLAVLAPLAGASTRTIERLFATETGMSFGAWRHRHRLIIALELLAQGGSVADAGYAVGFESPSSFIAAFRAMFGITPGRYFDIS
jgi:AraC-like DNA-binding protein